jgi:hypothetical protein
MHPFFKYCETVVRRKALPKKSELRVLMETRSKETGEIIISLGICMKGPTVALTHVGRVLCCEAGEDHFCEEDFDPCEFKAWKPDEAVSKWLYKVPAGNFLPGAKGSMDQEMFSAAPIKKMKDTLKMSTEEYSAEDYGGDRDKLFDELGISTNEEDWQLEDLEFDQKGRVDNWVRLCYKFNIIEDYVERRKRELANEYEKITIKAYYRMNLIGDVPD